MEITTDLIFSIINKRYKIKNSKHSNNFLSFSSFKDNPNKKDTKDNEKHLFDYFEGIILNEGNISNIIYNSIDKIKIVCFNNLQYLSLINNYLSNLNFIMNFPDLLYLDVYRNPLDIFDALNYKNTFVYLRFSVEKFNENKLLNIMGLNCIILDLEIKDKNILRIFKNNNINICLYSNEINYYLEKVIYEEKRKANQLKKFQRKQIKEIINYNFQKSNSINNQVNKDENMSEFTDRSSVDTNIGGYNINRGYLRISEKCISENIKKNIEYKNSFLIEIKRYFDDFNENITEITKKYFGNLNSNILKINDKYVELERRKLSLIYKAYIKLNEFNEKKRQSYFYYKNNEYLDENEFTSNITIYNFFHYIKTLGINIRFALIILTSILFLTLNIIQMKLAITIIQYLLKKYYNYDEHKQFPKIKIYKKIHLLCIYAEYLNDFINKLKFADKKQIILYKKIIEILKIKKLLFKSNILQKKRENVFSKNKKNDLINENIKKSRISAQLEFLKELNINTEILILIEFFCDFIIYEDIEQYIIDNSGNDDYSNLIELKEILEQIEFEKNNNTVKNLSSKRYYKNKLERIYNKFYFKNEKIKKIKNDRFPDITETMNINSSNKFSDIVKNKSKKVKVKPMINSMDNMRNINKTASNFNADSIKYIKPVFNSTYNIFLNPNFVRNKKEKHPFQIGTEENKKNFLSCDNIKNSRVINLSDFEFSTFTSDKKSNRNLYFSNKYIPGELHIDEINNKTKNNFIKNFESNIKKHLDKDDLLRKENIKLKIKQIDLDNANINAYRLYSKKNIFKINICKRNGLLGDELTIKKYNKIGISNNLRKISEDKKIKYNNKKRKVLSK